MTKISFSIPISPNQGFFNQVELFNHSLRKLGGIYESVPLNIIVGDNCDIEEVKSINSWSNGFNINWLPVPHEIFNKYGIHGTANWRFLAPDNSDISFFCDADTIILKPIDELIDLLHVENPKIAGHQAHFPPPLDIKNTENADPIKDVWDLLFDAYNIQATNKNVRYSMDTEKTLPLAPPYFNLGFVAMNKNAKDIIAKEIFNFEDAFVEKYDSFMRCQIAVTIVSLQQNIEIISLGAEYNSANDLVHFSNNNLSNDTIKILHYLRENEYKRSEFLEEPHLTELLRKQFENPINEVLRNTVRSLITTKYGNKPVNLNADFLNETELHTIGFKWLGKNVLIHKSCIIINPQNIEIGDNVRIDGFTIISASKHITIGNYVHIASHCRVFGNEEITFSEFSGCSSNVSVISSTDDFSGNTLTNPTVPDEFRAVKSMPIFIGRHVIIGTNTVILPGSCLAEGVAIGANSLVSGDVPQWEIYGGTPAKFIKNRSKNLLELEAKFLKSLN